MCIIQKLILLFLLLSSFLLCAQNSEKKADVYLKNGEYIQALYWYKKSYQKKPNSNSAIKIANIHYKLKSYEDALSYYRASDKIGNQLSPEAVFQYVSCLKVLQKYQRAKEILSKYEINDTDLTLLQISCDSSIKWVQHPTMATVKNMPIINTSFSEIDPTVSIHHSLIYASNHESHIIKTKTNTDGNPYYKLYSYSKEKKSIHPLFNTFSQPIHEGKAAFDKEGKEMFFTRTYHIKSSNKVSQSIFKSIKDSTGWSTPQILNFGDSESRKVHPSITPDGNIFIFSSNMPGGLGGMDLYISIKIADVWSSPINMGPSINTSYNEIYPNILNDSTLYFSSDHPRGMGGFDLYKSNYLNNEWSSVTNLKYPINSSYDDYSITFIHPHKGYFASNRPEGKGKEDIYSFILPSP